MGTEDKRQGHQDLEVWINEIYGSKSCLLETLFGLSIHLNIETLLTDLPFFLDSHREAVDVSSHKKKKFVSPRDKVTAGLFGHDENAEHESGRAAKIAYQKELQKQVSQSFSILSFWFELK